MNLDTSSTIMMLAGVILLYSAVKNKWPQDVVLETLGKKGSGKFIYNGTVTSITPIIPPGDPRRGAAGGGGSVPKFMDLNLPFYTPRV